MKYGLRLVWIPPMNSEGLLVEGIKIHKSTSTAELSEGFSPDNSVGNNTDSLAAALKSTERAFGKSFKLEQNVETAKKEKAFLLQEKIVLGKNSIVNGKVETALVKYNRPVYTFPLTSVEMPVNGSDLLKDYTGGFDSNSDISKDPNSPFAQLRQQLLDSEEYKFLFEYVFPLPRIATLMTIYTANSIGLAKPEVNNAFNNTKETCRSLFYTLSADANNAWWERKDEKLKEVGGNAGLLNTYLDNQSLKPTSGKDWTSVPLLWPVTWWGWGPPLTPLGMMAYSMPQLTGDKKQNEKNDLQDKINKNPDSLAEDCEDE